MTVGITVCTMDRPEYCEKVVKSIRKHLIGVVDHLVVVNDGSSAKHNGSYRRVEKAVQSINGTYIGMDVNRGVAVAKNIGLQFLLDKDCTHIFTLEDDILITSPKAVTEYIRIADASGANHFSYAWHGPANQSGPLETVDEIDYFGHSIGAWVMYTREALLTHGLLDENFHNAWEHVHMELKLGAAPHRFPDIADSANYLSEIPGSIDHSSIRNRNDWSSSIRDGLLYWHDNDKTTYESLFGPSMPLHAYAQSIIG